MKPKEDAKNIRKKKKKLLQNTRQLFLVHADDQWISITVRDLAFILIKFQFVRMKIDGVIQKDEFP